MTDDRKLNERQEFIDVSYGEAEAARKLLHTLGQQFQPAALNNQFVKTEASPDEIEKIRSFYSDAAMNMAELLDYFIGIQEVDFHG